MSTIPLLAADGFSVVWLLIIAVMIGSTLVGKVMEASKKKQQAQRNLRFSQRDDQRRTLHVGGRAQWDDVDEADIARAERQSKLASKRKRDQAARTQARLERRQRSDEQAHRSTHPMTKWSREDWRNAFVAQEVLARPVSLQQGRGQRNPSPFSRVR